MDYPSTTQALFALIVMIIVLAFILVYCCWGTFSCPRPDDLTRSEERESLRDRQDRSASSTPPAFFILPYRNMIYVGDGRTQRVFQIPINEDKPPSYSEIFANVSHQENCAFNSSRYGAAPPTYEQCFRYGNTAVMIDNCMVSSQTNLSSSNPQCILSPRTLAYSSSSLRESPTSEIPFQSSNLKTASDLSLSPTTIKALRKVSSIFGQNSQSNSLPASLFMSQTNCCNSSPSIPTVPPILDESFQSVAHLSLDSELVNQEKVDHISVRSCSTSPTNFQQSL